MIALAATKGWAVFAALGLPGTPLAEPLKLFKNPSLGLRSNDPHKQLFYWKWELEQWRSRRAEIAKDRPSRTDLIDLCKRFETEAESRIKWIEEQLKHPPPVPMLRGNGRSLDDVRKELERLREERLAPPPRPVRP